MRLYEAIAIARDSKENCIAAGNLEWAERWEDRLWRIERNFLPSGSGFDNGSTIDRSATNAKRIVILTAFHHMNENGYYDGWSEHVIRVTPNLARRFDMTISGRNRNEIKDYIGDTIHAALDAEITWEQLDGERLSD